MSQSPFANGAGFGDRAIRGRKGRGDSDQGFGFPDAGAPATIARRHDGQHTEPGFVGVISGGLGHAVDSLVRGETVVEIDCGPISRRS